MEDFLGAPLAAIRGLTLFAAIEEEIERPLNEPQDGRLVHLRGCNEAELRVFQPVLQNPDEYLWPRQAPFEELPGHWEEFSGNNYLGLQQHGQEEWDAAEQVEDTGNEEEDLDCTKSSSQDVDAMSSASQPVSKRGQTITDNCRLLKAIGSSSSSVATFGLQGSAMPGASPEAFVPILEPVTSVTTPEVQKLNI